jgi:hypothetical protein
MTETVYNFGVLLFVGSLFLFAGAYAYIRDKKKLERLKIVGTLITATVTSVRVEPQGGDSADKRFVYFSYTVNGEEHQNMIEGTRLYEGDKLELYVNEDNPSDFIPVKSHTKMFFLLFAVMGFIMIILDFFLVIRG